MFQEFLKVARESDGSRVDNIRLGFATNSSSYHSVLIHPGHAWKDDLPSDGHFDWSAFLLVSREEKLRYVVAQLSRNNNGSAIILKILQKYLGLDIGSASHGIDHASSWMFPKERSRWGWNGYDTEFIEAILEFFSRDDVVIVGGNDNDCACFDERFNEIRDKYAEEHGGSLAGFYYDMPEARPCTCCDGAMEESQKYGFRFPLVFTGEDSVVRHDKVYDYWTIMDKETGEKVRVSFKNQGMFATVEGPSDVSSSPELVDLKITDRCGFNCAFCYQDSTSNGVHASYDNIIHVLDSLYHLGVFEVALGGGDPLIHPHFLDILKYCHDLGIKANFSTRSLLWLKDVETTRVVLENMGGFAFSVLCPDDVERFVCAIEGHGLNGYRATAQVVVGGVSETDFREILSRASKYSVHVTLLGPKKVGRGATHATWHEYDWVKIYKESLDSSNGPILGVDTCLVDPVRFKEMGIPEWCYVASEGRFSMYIDAVTMTMGPSSFADKSAMVPLVAKDGRKAFLTYKEQILKHFPWDGRKDQ